MNEIFLLYHGRIVMMVNKILHHIVFVTLFSFFSSTSIYVTLICLICLLGPFWCMYQDENSYAFMTFGGILTL